jgi:hypothetical protein
MKAASAKSVNPDPRQRLRVVGGAQRKGRWDEANRSDRCPICDSDSWCTRLLADDGGSCLIVDCKRVADPSKGHYRTTTDRHGTTHHYHTPGGTQGAGVASGKRATRAREGAVAPADEATRHRAYLALLEAASLGDAHCAQLRARGLDPALAAARGYPYGTLPMGKRYELAHAVRDRTGLSTDVLKTVPGFYWWSPGEGGELRVAGPAGLLVPVRGPAGTITGVQVRPDEPSLGPKYVWLTSRTKGGAGAVVGPHCPHFERDRWLAVQAQHEGRKVARLTEGPIKSELAQLHTGMWSVAVPGVGMWGLALRALREQGIEVVRLAFDADWRDNPTVAVALALCARRLVAQGFALEVETWDGNQGKGIDDLLAAGGSPVVLTGIDAVRLVRDAPGRHDRAAVVAGEDAPAWVRWYVEHADGTEFYSDRDLLAGIALLKRGDPAAFARIESFIREHSRKFSMRTFASTIRDFERQAAQAARVAQSEAAAGDDLPYREQGGCLSLVTESGLIPLANFTARIVAQVERHEGGGVVRRQFAIEATHESGRKGKAAVDARDFEAMAWVHDALGAEFTIAPGRGMKDYVRHAIQSLSTRDTIAHAIVYTNTGWIDHNGTCLYLHAGGALGADGPSDAVRVELDPALARYRLPAVPTTPERLREAIGAAVDILDLGVKERPCAAGIAATAAAAPWRAVLGPFNGTVHFSGTTGSLKTSTACLPVQHFAPAHDYAMPTPASWDSTGNALQALQHAAKDAVLLVDDLVVDGPDAERAQAKASTVLSSQGNLKGRQRMRPDGTLAGELDPRCALLSTGETDPARRSARGRALVVRFTPNDDGGEGGSIDLATLTRLQRDAAAGRFAEALAAYVQALARPGRLEAARAEHKRLVDELRAEALKQAQGTHPRHPSTLAELGAAYRLFLTWAVDVGALTRREADSIADTHWKGLLSLLEVQAQAQRDADPGERFLACLVSAMSSRQAYVADAVTNDVPDDFEAVSGWYQELKYEGDNRLVPIWVHGPNAQAVGWIDRKCGVLWLNREAAFAAAQRVARAQGNGLGEPGAVWARLAEMGAITTQRRRKTDARVNLTVRRVIGKHRLEVAEMPIEQLWPAPDKSDTGGTTTQGEPADAF